MALWNLQWCSNFRQSHKSNFWLYINLSFDSKEPHFLTISYSNNHGRSTCPYITRMHLHEVISQSMLFRRVSHWSWLTALSCSNIFARWQVAPSRRWQFGWCNLEIGFWINQRKVPDFYLYIRDASNTLTQQRYYLELKGGKETLMSKKGHCLWTLVPPAGSYFWIFHLPKLQGDLSLWGDFLLR